MPESVDPSATFPETQTKGPSGGRTRGGKKILESGFNQPPFKDGGGHFTVENVTDGIPMKDTPHPHTGEDITGGY